MTSIINIVLLPLFFKHAVLGGSGDRGDQTFLSLQRRGQHQIGLELADNGLQFGQFFREALLQQV